MRMRFFLILLVAILLVSPASQAAIWAARAVGGTTIDDFESLIQTRDGGYLGVGGSVYVSGFNFYFRAWVARMDANGTVKWHKVISGGWIDDLYVPLELTDGSFIIAGSIGHKGYVAKLDANGNFLWQLYYQGPNTTAFYDLQPTSDGGYIVAGTYYSSSFDAWVLKLDAAGQIVWQKTFGGSKSEYAYAVQTTTDGYYVSGNTDSFGTGDYDAWVLKLDTLGNVLWQLTFGGTKKDFSHFSSLAATSDGGCVIAGSTESFGAGSEDGWVIRLNQSANVIWQKAIGGKLKDIFNSVRQTSDKGFIVAGETESFGKGKTDAWTLKLDANGKATWQNTHGGSASDGADSILQLKDKSYLVGGNTSSYGTSGDGLILRIAKTGNACTLLTKKSTAATVTTGVTGKSSNATEAITAVIPVNATPTIYSIAPTNKLICSR